ncbi:unnamed protein product, partial [Ascophyllum nodosum]
GPGVSAGAVEDSTPLATGAYNAIVAFDETHCVEMCCEQQECYVAVFNEADAVCYLKAVGALGGAHDVAAEHLSSYTIESRIGKSLSLKRVNLTPNECNNKRGAAYGFKDVAALNSLKNGLSWWYDWSPGFLEDGILEASFAQGSYYIPMIWGKGDLEEDRLLHISRVGENSSYLLGFNEPNFKYQASLTAQEAAQLWSQVRLLAEDHDMDLVSPAMNFCGGECIEADPIQWLDDFFEECGKILGGCGIKYLAVHSYACEVRYLNKHMHVYIKYGLAIWLTEFACAFESTAATEASQAEYLSEALTYLELNPHIFRYAWFTAVSSPTDGVDNSDLLDLSTGQLTAVGEVFVSEYANLQRCEIESVSPADNETWTSMETETEPGNETSSPKLESTQTPEPIGAPLSSPTTADDDHYTTWTEPGNETSSPNLEFTQTPEPIGAPLSSPTTADDDHYTTSTEPGNETSSPKLESTQTPEPTDAPLSSPTTADDDHYTTWTEPGNETSSPNHEPTQTPEPIDAPLSSPTTADDDHYTTWNAPEVSAGELSDGKGEDLELDVDPKAEVIKNAVITNVGGSGYFDTVVNMIDGENMSCSSLEDTCVKEQVSVSGELAPFDEVSVAFRGPMNLYNIACYEGTADGTLERTSKWTPGSEGENIVFMKNLGGVNGCAGEWSICGGNSQSYADASGISCSSKSTAFSGNLPDDNEVNIMTASECASNAQCGFYRDVGMRGWQGGEDGTKVIIFEVDMPHCEENACAWNRPAVWALNARVLRTAQYGCNCRSMGDNGGCGEFDILEAVVGNPYSDMLFTQVYDFKGAGGPGPSRFFERPSRNTTYAAVFRGGQDSYLQVVELDGWDFGSATLVKGTLDQIKGNTSYKIYDVDSIKDPQVRHGNVWGILKLGSGLGLGLGLGLG